MITIFTSCKPFRGRDAVAQRNAIGSWKALSPQPEILLLGDDEGTAEYAREFGVRHIPHHERNEFGKPYVSKLFEEAQRVASHDTICYLNADIILLDDFMPGVAKAARWDRPFLLVGKRVDLDVNEEINFKMEWQSELKNQVREQGRLFHLPGMDYFVFRKNQWPQIPPFVLGNIRWDNWMVYEARRLKIPVIDATNAITAVHQNHERKHAEESDEGGISSDPAAVHNLSIYGKGVTAFFHLDATHVLTANGIRRAFSAPYLKRLLMTVPVFKPSWEPVCSRIRAWVK